MPPHVDALMLACAERHGRTYSEEMRYAAEAWGVMSALHDATAQDVPDVRRQAAGDLRGVLQDGLGGVPIEIAA